MKPLLDLIRRYESGDNYNAIWGGIPRQYYPRDHVSVLTVSQVMDVQSAWLDRRQKSTAIGAYQFISGTLKDVVRKTGTPLNAKFGPKLQDKLAMELLERRGLSKWKAGKINDEAFALNLAKEWASLPVPFDVVRNGRTVKRGQSYYAGDGLNQAHAPVDAVLRALDASRGATPSNPLAALLRLILGLLRAIFERK